MKTLYGFDINKEKYEAGNSPPMTYREEDKKWIPATPEPYYPNLIEKIRHLLGIHLYPEYDEKTPHGRSQCLICYKYK